MKPSDLAAYLFLALAWGLSFLVLVKVATAFGWVGAVTFRALLAGGALLAAAPLTGRRLDFGFGLKPLLIVGATTVALQLIGLSYGTPRIGTAMAAILVATIPLFSMLLGRLAGVERLTRSGGLGLVLGFSGIVALVGFPAEPATPDFWLGSAALIVSTLAAATGSVYASARLLRAGAWEVTGGAFLAGGVMTAPLLLAAPPPGVPAPLDWLWLGVLALGMSAAPYVLYFRLVQRIGATRAISVEFAVTVVAVLVGAAFLGERLTAVQIAGAATIVLGCALVLGLIGPRPARG
jgi:drug/metabolite transporter (DMT)-like permease